MKFDRIYIGAGAPKDARFLFKLLRYDGVMVGPLQDEDGSQSLARARCRGGRKYAVTSLLQVQFAELASPDGLDFGEKSQVVLKGPLWGSEKRALFPYNFERTVLLLYWMGNLDASLPSRLPWDLWMRYIIPYLPFDSFDPAPRERVCAACSSLGPARQCGRCRAVHYCGRPCQRQHWPSHKSVCVPCPPG